MTTEVQCMRLAARERSRKAPSPCILALFRAAALGSVVFMAGCATSPASHYYSLTGPSGATSTVAGGGDHEMQRGAGKPADGKPGVPFAISLQSVKLPELVDRNQIVVTDPSTTQVHVLDSYLWAAPLADEVRAALSKRLQQRLGVFDITASQLPADLAAWKISVTVQGFESVYDSHVAVDLDWIVSPVNQKGKATRVCGARARVPVDGVGVGSLVRAHRQALAGMAELMASQLVAVGSASLSPQVQSKGCTLA